MNAVSRSSRIRVGSTAVWNVLGAVLIVVRVALYGVLAMIEPVVRVVLLLTCIICLAASGFYKFFGPASVHFPYGVALSIGVGAAVLYMCYVWILGALEPRSSERTEHID